MANRIADPAVYTTKTTLGGGELLHSNDANQDRLFTVDTLSTYAGNKAIPPGYIDGLVLTWVSGTALTVTSGSAYIPSLARVLRAPSDIAKTGLSLAASTWYHVYLYLNGSTPDIEVVTTAPSATYNGGARTKTSDNSRRYLGSVKTNSSSSIFGFSHNQQTGSITYTDKQGFSTSAGKSTTPVIVDVSGNCPVTSVSANFLMSIDMLGAFLMTGSPSMPNPLSSNNYMGYVQSSGQVAVATYPDHPIDSLQRANYMVSATPSSGSGIYLTVLGYKFSR